MAQKRQGLPQSKTLARSPVTPGFCSGCRFFETALNAEKFDG